MKLIQRINPSTLWLPLFLLVLVDAWLVRDASWLFNSFGGKRFWVNYLLSMLVWYGLWQTFKGRNRWLRYILVAWVGAAFYTQTAYYAVYEKLISTFDIRFFLSDPLMSLSLYGENGSFLQPIAASLTGMILANRGLRASPANGWRLWAWIILSSSVFALLTINWYSAPNLQIAPVSLTSAVARLADVRAGKNTSKIQKTKVPAQPMLPDAPDIVWVIGESLNKNHLELYDYARPTTPFLSSLQTQSQLIAFKDALSVGPRTMVSVPYLMTGLQNIDPNGLIYGAPTIFNYAKAAGYTTALITSQDFQWRNIDRMFVDQDMDFFRQGSDFSADVNVSVGADDQVMFERGVQRFLEQSASKGAPRLLVTQLSGSHPPFDRQVPAAKKQFLPEESANSINAYDNTVWYTDYYLSRLVQTLRAQRPNTWIFFTTDHGTHVTGQGKKFHGGLDEPVVRVPLVVIPPIGKMARLRVTADTPVMHADIMATSLDLMNIQTVSPISGNSMLQEFEIPRLRVTTAYVKTLHNDPVAALDVGSSQRYEIRFDQSSVTTPDGSVIPYDALPQKYRAVFDPILAP